jgi:sortase A
VRPRIGKRRLGQVLKWSRRALFTIAAGLLGYCAFSLVDAWIFQIRANRALDRLMRERHATTAGPPLSGSLSSPKGALVAEDGLIGRIEIARLQLSVVVAEGTDKIILRRAVGHIPGTALPCEAGNVGLAGHRDTFFRPLKDLKINDEIEVSTISGSFQYQVESLKVVDPSDIQVLASTGQNVLTLVTCYPFYYVGPAPKRYIVRALQVYPHAADGRL